MFRIFAYLILGFVLLGASPAGLPEFPKSFLDISLERRCDLLSKFVTSYARRHLNPNLLTQIRCSESNGLGGARYEVEITAAKAGMRRQYQILVSYDGSAQLSVCDRSQSPPACAVNKPTDRLRFQVDKKRFRSKESAEQAANTFYRFHPNMRELVPTLWRWMNAPQRTLMIYGQVYDDYIRNLIEHPIDLPVIRGAKTQRLRVVFKPHIKTDPRVGTIFIDAPVDRDFLKCFECSDRACINTSVEYRFEGRLLSFARGIFPLTKDPGKSGNSGAGWIMDGKRPFFGQDPQWRYVCGVSRYNLQKVKL